MWNPFKTLTERDSARLRRLERTVEELGDDVEKVLMLTGKVNARLRQRARRALDNGEEAASESSEQVTSPGIDQLVLPSYLEPSSTPTSSLHTLPLYSKEQMRGFARQRGLLPSMRSSQNP